MIIEHIFTPLLKPQRNTIEDNEREVWFPFVEQKRHSKQPGNFYSRSRGKGKTARKLVKINSSVPKVKTTTTTQSKS